MSNEEKSFPKTSINWYPGHMLKTKKQIIEDLKLIDVVVQVLDARIPLSSQNPDIQKIVKQKKQIVLLNKSDLANNKETQKWKEYFLNKNIPALIIDANLGKGVRLVIEEVEKILQAELEKVASKGRQNKNIRVMIIGIPNVGKSSLINRLTNKKTAQVGNRPGVTKQKQWVRISKNIELLDTPGVLWPKFENYQTALNLSYVGTIKDELLPKEDVAYELLKYLWDNYRNNIIARYNLTEEEISNIILKDAQNKYINLMELIARKRGSIVAGGEVELEKVSNLLFSDFRTGKIGKITLEKIEI